MFPFFSQTGACVEGRLDLAAILAATLLTIHLFPLSNGLELNNTLRAQTSSRVQMAANGTIPPQIAGRSVWMPVFADPDSRLGRFYGVGAADSRHDSWDGSFPYNGFPNRTMTRRRKSSKRISDDSTREDEKPILARISLG
ncbi:hypothetical protein BV898_08718 [Hypsibius exemplaris]|uniref:Uncharacterized protein n=1 Tax=Hypsibius exemplaris TaxID=2072580 RepID=A0A1W0WPR7_HYPEX|nr:hypothetical protein BV898_08718 [Hypsibius exemplaris]